MGVFGQLVEYELEVKRKAMVRGIAAIEARNYRDWQVLVAMLGCFTTPEDEAWYRETYPSEN